MFLVGVGGFALAFVPYEGRSLDVWFFAFIRSIYQPTLFFWKKTNPVPEAFTYIQPRFLDLTPTVNYSGIRTQRAKDFLATIPKDTSRTQDIPDEDTSAILALFSEPAVAMPKTTTVKPSAPPPTNVIPIFQQNTKEVVVKPQPTPITITPQAFPENKPTQVFTTQEVTSIARSAPTPLHAVETSNKLPFPKPPFKPNMIVGMTFSGDQNPKIIDGAIVEITNMADGTPVRALRTNALGQFAIVTPLNNGQYEISVEKAGYTFDKTSLVLNNQVVQPLLIQAKL
jgi:hypothetical protein